METKTPTPSSLKVLLGHRLNENDTSLVRRCLELIAQYSGPGFSVIDGIDKNSHEVSRDNAFIDLSTTTDPLSALQTITNTLSEIGQSKLSDALDHVLYLCTEDRELGGQGLSPIHPLIDADREKILSFFDSWLYASTHDTQVSGTELGESTEELRPMTLSEKIFMHHILPENRITGLKAGDVVPVSVDWVLASEVSWKGMMKTINEVGATQIWRNDRFWLAADHIVDPRIEHLPKVKTLIEKSEKAQRDFKLTDYKGKNYTILHTEFVRERAQPGMLLVGSDSHTCSSGTVGCLGIGLGAADVAMSLLTGASWFKIPESIRIDIVGELGFGIGGKDVILHILGQLKRNTVAADRIVEFGGTGAKYLSCDDRFAICNMCTEFGAITGIFIPDPVVQNYINRRKRTLYKSSPLYFHPDDNAQYAETFTINLTHVQPYIALYPSPDNVIPVKDCSPINFDGVFIGACTTTEEDLILGGLVLQVGLQENLRLKKGKRHVVFGSLPITKRLRELGITEIYQDAGFRESAPGCSFCVGMGADQAGVGETWLSSQNRNFKNRMGRGSFGNLSSAAVVAASSFSMSLIDPSPFLEKVDRSSYRALTRKSTISRQTAAVIYVEPSVPKQQPSRQSQKPEIRAAEEIYGNNEWIISSRIQTLGDFIDTDALAPAEYLVECETDEAIGQHCMEHTFPEFRSSVKAGRQVIVAGESFGCGSSREEGPRALIGLGVKCVISKSFAFIYGRNQPTLGLLGITIHDESFYESATDNTEIAIDVYGRFITIGERKWKFDLDNLEIKMLQSKGLAEAYKRFGKNVFDNLCHGEGNTEGLGVGAKSIDSSLEW